jgi:hypothetical protein
MDLMGKSSTGVGAHAANTTVNAPEKALGFEIKIAFLDLDGRRLEWPGARAKDARKKSAVTPRP